MRVLTLTTYDEAPFLTQQIEALSERGVRSTVVSVPGDPTGTDGRSPTDYLRFLRTVRREAGPTYDLIHAHYGLLAPIALAQRQLPVVLSLWGSDVHGSVAPISQLGARFCDEVIVMSDAMAEAMNVECHVIPDGIDLDLFAPGDRAAAREAVGWSADGYDVLFPYSPDRTVKNYPRAERLVDAVDDAFERPVRLRTVSGVAHETVPTYMNAADALLLPSRSEGSPNVVKEAMACGLPVVATPVGDVPARLADVEPSVVAETDAELRRGLAAVLRSGRRSNGRDAVANLGLQHTTDAIYGVYRRALGHDDEAREPPARTTPSPRTR